MNAVTGKRDIILFSFQLQGQNMDVSIGSRMNGSAIKDLRYEWNLKILLKLHQP